VAALGHLGYDFILQPYIGVSGDEHEMILWWRRCWLGSQPF
jgi:hypothetical protein